MTPPIRLGENDNGKLWLFSNDSAKQIWPGIVSNPNPSITYINDVLSDNPLAFWMLDEEDGDIALSKVDNKNLNLIDSPVLAYEGPSDVLPKGIYFNSNNKRANSSTYSSWNIAQNSAWSVEAWVKFSTIGTTIQTFFSWGANNTSGNNQDETTTLCVNNGLSGRIQVNTSNPTDTGRVVVNSDLGWNDDKWHQVVATAASGGLMKLYIDGIERGSNSNARRNGNSSDRMITLASNRGPTFIQPFNGSIAAVSIYNYELSAARILSHYSLARPDKPPSFTTSIATWWASDLGLQNNDNVASWKDINNNMVISQSTNNARPIFEQEGINNKPSVNFDGVDDNLTMASAISNANEGSIIAVYRSSGSGFSAKTLWCASSTAANQQYLIGRMGHTIANQAGIQSHHGNTFDAIWQINEDVSSAANRVLEWSAANDIWSMRINNYIKNLIKRSSDSTPDQGYWFDDISTHNTWTIGSERFISGSQYNIGHFNMKLAYFGVFNKRLSARQRHILYSWINEYYGIALDNIGLSNLQIYYNNILKDNPSGYWPLNEETGVNAIDKTSFNRDGTYQGTFSLSSLNILPISDQVASFNTDGWVNLGDNDAWSCAGASGTISVEAWIRPNAINLASQFIISKFSEWQLRIQSDGRVLWDVNTGLSSVMNITSPSPLVVNNIYHIVGTYNRSTPRLELWINGILVTSSNSASGTASNGTHQVWIAGRSDNASTKFNGSIGHVAIYPNVLSKSQIEDHFNFWQI